MAEGDTEQFRKIFVGGLHLNTTDESLKQFYEQWGNVVDCIVMRDPNTKRSRCFGFVTYSDAHMVDECMAARPHVIDTKTVDTKRAMPREDANKQDTHKPMTKIFVGGIRDNIDENSLKEYFGQFGQVKSAEIVQDKETGKKRGIAFVTFEDYDVVDKIVLIKMHTINGVQIEAKKAMERDQKGGAPFGGGRGGRGGRGGGDRGGRGRGGGYADRSASGYGGAYGGPGQYGDSYGAGAQQGYGGGGYGANGYGAGGGWNQGGYGPGAPAGGMGGGFGSGYGGGYGGGAMKNTAYNQRATGPYGGGYGTPGGYANQAGGYGGQAGYTAQTGGYGNGAGAYGGGYGSGYGGPGYGGQR